MLAMSGRVWIIGGMENMNYQIGEAVWVKCPGSDVWARGTVVRLTAKRIVVTNEGRALDGAKAYSPANVRKITN